MLQGAEDVRAAVVAAVTLVLVDVLALAEVIAHLAVAAVPVVVLAARIRA